jgi:hypothetical protein
MGLAPVGSSFFIPLSTSIVFVTSRFCAGALISIPFALMVVTISTTTLSVPTSTSVLVIRTSDFIPAVSLIVLMVTLVPGLYLLQDPNSGFGTVSFSCAKAG